MTLTKKKNAMGQHGFTLIELLVVMGVSTVLLGGIYAAFLHQQRSYVVEDLTARAQQNLRVGMLMVSREVRAAGSALGTRGVNAAEENANLWQGITIADNNPDVIHIVYADASCTAETTGYMPSTSAVLDVDDVSCFASDDLLIITQFDRHASIFQVTNTNSSSNKIQHNPNMDVRNWNQPGNRNWPTGPGYAGYGNPPDVAQLYRVRLVSFRVDATTNMLQMDPTGSAMSTNAGLSAAPNWMDIAEDITDLQAIYIFADGSTATTFDSTGATATIDDDYESIRSVQITMTARTHQPMPNSVSATFPAGQFRTRVLQETVRLRNFGLRT